MVNRKILAFCALLAAPCLKAQTTPGLDAGADERTPARAQYFTWINHTNEGTTEEQTLTNLRYFEWLKRTYGMQLDIYAFDAGVVDGAKFYGDMESARFRRLFPRGFDPISRQAARMGVKLGLWGGPDGFGNTEEEARRRMEMMTGLVRDYGFGLFKMDMVCGPLRPSKYGYFEEMMAGIRRIDPQLVLLNHRLELGPGTRFSTTYLLGGDETYIDAHMTNRTTATHHRVGALSRPTPDTRLTEDHGVCLSSCLDYWEDDVVLQAFCRNLILAPEIYGNPWLLRDDEQSRLAFLFNLHRDYRDILVEGKRLPEAAYGPEAMSRGDERTRFLTLRNLTWQPVTYTVRLDEEIGLSKGNRVAVRQYHPYVEYRGSYRRGDVIRVEVLPFRACLLKCTTERERDRVRVNDCAYQVVDDRVAARPVVQRLGRALPTAQWHRHIGDLQSCEVPADAAALYYATLFAADNNPFEVRELRRSGPTQVPEVQAARDAFFRQPTFVRRELWDRNLFDGDPSTAFSIAWRGGDIRPHGASGFSLDLGEPLALDSLVLTTTDEYTLQPLKVDEGCYAYVSTDLVNWRSVTFLTAPRMTIDLRQTGPVRYLRFAPCPIRLTEVTGYRDGKQMDCARWRASNLFQPYGEAFTRTARSWSHSFRLDTIPEGSYLCIAVQGRHGVEGAWAACKVDGAYVGCPDRAPSFMANTWERRVQTSDHDYTYYLPLTPEMAGRTIETFVLAFDSQQADLHPQVWVTCYPIPFERAE